MDPNIEAYRKRRQQRLDAKQEELQRRIDAYRRRRSERICERVTNLKWTDEKTAVEIIASSGIIPTPCSEAAPMVRANLSAAVKDCLPWLKPYLKGTEEYKGDAWLFYIYPFEQSKQDKSIDGWSSTFVSDPPGGSCIGLADVVILGGGDYLRLCLLHETAHLQYMDHSPSFVHFLNWMIFEYNQMYGTALENDLSESGIYLDPSHHYTFNADGVTGIA